MLLFIEYFLATPAASRRIHMNRSRDLEIEICFMIHHKFAKTLPHLNQIQLFSPRIC